MSLIALCASHIDSTQKLEYIQEMLQSWNNQTYKSYLYLSISVDEQFRKDLDDLAKIWETCYTFTISIANEKQSQFMHYNKLVNVIKRDDPWVIFTDDDDIWHEHRAEVFHQTIQNIESKNVLFIRAPLYCENNSNKFDPLNVKLVKSTRTEMGNYIEYCCRLSSLKDFCDRASDYVLNHYLADMLFVRYLRVDNKKQTCFLTELDDSNWMYYYRGFQNSITEKTNRNFILNNFYADKMIFLNNKALQIKENKDAAYALINNISLFLLCKTKKEYDNSYSKDLYVSMCKQFNYIKGKQYEELFYEILDCGIIDKLLEAPVAE